MKNRKEINFFLAFIAIILGVTLFKHFNFKTFRFADPALDVLYLAVFLVSIILLIRDYRSQPAK